MSFKIIDRIKKLDGLSGKYKRVLEAWASFGNKDGTNIRPSADRVADRAGVSRWTVYRNTEDLLEVGVLVDTGERYNYKYGHWVPIYRIESAMLQNATEWIEKLCSKTQHRQCSKMPKSYVAKCDATIGSNPSASLQDEPDPTSPSAVSTAGVSEVASQLVPPVGGEISEDAINLIRALHPSRTEVRRSYALLAQAIVDHFGSDARFVLRWNQTHKNGGLVIRSMEQWHKIDLVKQYDEYKNHIPDECKVCLAKKHLIAEFNSYRERSWDAGEAKKKNQPQSGSCSTCGLMGHNVSGGSCQDCYEVAEDRKAGDAIGICKNCGVEKRITGTPACVACSNGWQRPQDPEGIDWKAAIAS